MISAESKQAIESLCPEVSEEIIQDFFARMDQDYFATFSPEEISTHIRMSCALDPEHPAQCRITQRDEDEFDIIIVGLDYLSEFSIFCGLLSAFGLDIRAGKIYSFAGRTSGAARRRPTHSSKLKASQLLPRKIVDVFNIRLKPGAAFDEAKQREFEQELQTLVRMLASGSSEQARERLNRFLTERIESMDEQLSGLLSPVEVRLDNQLSPDWTVMDAQSEDAFAFLYAFSNALSLRGIYIHKVEIQSVGREARDRFFIADRRGRKIEDEKEQERLRTAVALIKQFTRFLPEAPDPAKAMRHFDQFLDKIAEERIPERMVSFFAGNEGMNLLAHLLGSSDFLWDDFLGLRFKDLLPILPILEDFTKTELRPGKQSLRQQLAGRLSQAATFEEKKDAFNRFKDSQVFLIDVKHLLDPQVTLMDFSQALTDLAEVALDEAARICYDRLVELHGEPTRADGSPCQFTICGLGKFGGREMGYASDLEVLFVHDGRGRTSGDKPIDNGLFFEHLAQQVVEFIEAREKGIFHIDLRLRPHGKAGALATPFERLENYYSEHGEAAPFERQSLIKLRWVAGDEALGRRVEAHCDSYTYSGAPWDWENALHLRRRQTRELVKPGRINVKYSPGGIIDIEYAAQYLQLMNGRNHPELRVTSTLEALDQLRRLRIISETDYEMLREAYLFLRNLIDALRIVRGDASDLLLPEEDSEEFKSLARRLGYRERDWKLGAVALAADIRQCMKKVNSYYVARFDSPVGTVPPT